MKHWTQFLSEAGQIRRHGDDQITRKRQIMDLENKLSEMKREYREHECEIIRLASNEWTLDEIIKAKHQAADDSLQNLI